MELIYFREVVCEETGASRSVYVPVGGGTVLPLGTLPSDGVCGCPQFGRDHVAALLRGGVVAYKGRRYYKQ